MSTQALDTGSELWPYLISTLSTILLCLFGLYGVSMLQGQRVRRLNRRGSDVELGTAPTASIRIVRKAPSVVSRPAPAPVRPSADSQPPAAMVRGATTRRFRIPGWPPRSRVEAQAFLRRRVGFFFFVSHWTRSPRATAAAASLLVARRPGYGNDVAAASP